MLLEWDCVCVDGSEKASRMMIYSYVAGRTGYISIRRGGTVSMTYVFACLFIVCTVTRL